ncbi:MAG: alpha/beta hydrolase [Melioribacteraceae bacterium]|nr:alpha/beta hydrolase [Melioribacteraceae bacterium]
MKRIFIALIFVQLFLANIVAQEENAILTPVEYSYKTVDTTELSAFVFFPEEDNEELRSAVLVFHGGGWDEGTPEWAFSRGRHFVQQGLVAVAVEYRLSDQKTITPLDAMEDSKDAVRWLRRNGRRI